MNHKTREFWLLEATDLIREQLFKPNSYIVPPIKVSIGFPGGGSPRKRIGEHWSPEASDDKIGSIFISPTLDDSKDALSVLVHELVHAAVGNKCGHGGPFKRCALAVGLEGKMRSTTASAKLNAYFETLILKIGAYPHAKLNLAMRPTKKQSTRMIKLECTECGYIVRTSNKNIETHGPVLCPCNHEPMSVCGGEAD